MMLIILILLILILYKHCANNATFYSKKCQERQNPTSYSSTGRERCQQQNICFCFPLGGRCCAPCPMVSLMLNLFLLPSLTWESPHSEQLLGGMSPLGHWGRMSARFYFSMNVFFFKLPKYSNEIWIPIPQAFLLQSRPQPGALTLQRWPVARLNIFATSHRVMAILLEKMRKTCGFWVKTPRLTKHSCGTKSEQ